MQKRFIVVIAIGFGTFMTASFAARSKLPDAVATDLKAFAAECVEVGGKAPNDKAIVSGA